MGQINISTMTTDTVNTTTSSDVPWNNTSVEQLLLNNLGPKRLPLNWIIPLTAVYALIFLTGLVGNICTCLVIARNQYMQTATNCYLFNLAIADMLTLLVAAVVIAFFVCWAPFHAQRLLFVYVSLKRKWTEKLRTINQDLFSIAGCFYYFNSTVNPILYSVMSNRFRVAFREKLCAEPPSLWCICCCCFCCVKDFEKRSQRTVIYRNSNSHSSVRSYISFPPNNNKTGSNNNNNSLPRARSLGVDFNEKQGITLSWARNIEGDEVVVAGVSNPGRKFGNTLTISPPLRHSRHTDSNASSRSSKSIEKKSTIDSTSSGKGIEDEDEAEKSELTEELDEAIRPELDKLAESDKACVNCTNCTLLFPQKLSKNANEAPDKSVASEITYLECSSGKYSPEIMESIV